MLFLHTAAQRVSNDCKYPQDLPGLSIIISSPADHHATRHCSTTKCAFCFFALRHHLQHQEVVAGHETLTRPCGRTKWPPHGPLPIDPMGVALQMVSNHPCGQLDSTTRPKTHVVTWIQGP